MSWLAWQKVMVVSGNAGRNFSPPRPPCPVTITLTHPSELLRSLLLPSLCSSSHPSLSPLLCFSIRSLPLLIAPLTAFAHRSAHAFATRFAPPFAPPFRSSLCSSLCSSLSLVPFAPRFAPPFRSSLSLLPFAPPFLSSLHSSLSLLASPFTFAPLLAHHWLDFTTQADFRRGNCDGPLRRR